MFSNEGVGRWLVCLFVRFFKDWKLPNLNLGVWIQLHRNPACFVLRWIQMDSDVMKWNRQGRKKMVRNPAMLLCLDLSLRPLSCWPTIHQHAAAPAGDNSIEGKDTEVQPFDALADQSGWSWWCCWLCWQWWCWCWQRWRWMNDWGELIFCSSGRMLGQQQCANPPNPTYLAQTPPIWPNFTPNPFYLP